jgi:hypothetical protein
MPGDDLASSRNAVGWPREARGSDVLNGGTDVDRT